MTSDLVVLAGATGAIVGLLAGKYMHVLLHEQAHWVLARLLFRGRASMVMTIGNVWDDSEIGGYVDIRIPPDDRRPSDLLRIAMVSVAGQLATFAWMAGLAWLLASQWSAVEALWAAAGAKNLAVTLPSPGRTFLVALIAMPIIEAVFGVLRSFGVGDWRLAVRTDPVRPPGFLARRAPPRPRRGPAARGRRECRLGDVLARGRAREVPLVGDRDEVAELPQIHTLSL